MDSILNDFEKTYEFDLTKAFFIMNRSVLYLLLVAASRSRFTRGKLIFENILFDFELLQVHYIAKTLDDRLKKQLLKR